MPSASVYRNQHKGRKVALRVVGCDAHFQVGDFAIEKEDVREVYITRIMYSGNVTIWRGATATTYKNSNVVVPGTDVKGGKALFILTGNGDWDFAATGIQNQELASGNVTVETGGANDTCVLQLEKSVAER